MSILKRMAHVGLAAAIAFQPFAAIAAGKPQITLTKPPALDWGTLIKVLEDGKIDGGDAVGLGFEALWHAIGNMIARVDLCIEAARAGEGLSGPYNFDIGVTVVDGDKSKSFNQSVRVIPTAHGIMALGLVKPGGGFIITFWCGNWAADAPWPEDEDADGDGDKDPRGGGGDGGSGDGLDVLSFTTSQGRVAVFLPDDVRAGDTISGTVVISPTGRTPAQQTSNGDTLNGLVLDVGGVRTPVRNGFLRFTIPAGGATGLAMTLRSGGGRVLDQETVPLVRAAAPAPARVALPEYGQPGRPVPIRGVGFDGDITNTSVSVGGEPAAVLAESPRAIIVAPPLTVGQTTIQLREGQQQAQGRFRNIVISLSAAKTTLLRGEQTTVMVQVDGLQGLTAPVPMQLTATPSVQLQGGNAQTLMIRPEGVDPRGRFVVNLNLQAVTAGGFGVTAVIGLP